MFGYPVYVKGIRRIVGKNGFRTAFHSDKTIENILSTSIGVTSGSELYKIVFPVIIYKNYEINKA